MVNMKKSTIFGLIFLALVFSISLISAQTLITGKIYDLNSGSPVVLSGADVKIFCNNYAGSDITTSEGVYGVLISGSDCFADDTVIINVSMEGYVGATETGVVIACNDSAYQHDCTTNNVERIAVINAFLEKVPPAEDTGDSGTSSGSGGGGGGGGSIFTITRVNQTNQTIQNATAPGNETSSGNETFPEETNNQGLLSRITGAVVGAGTAAQIGIILLIIALILAAYFAVRYFGAKEAV